MKVVLFALFLALCMATKISADEGLINFEMDVHENSPVGLFVKGSIDPQNQQKNQIEAFIKLANTYIPLLKGLADADKSLKWSRTWVVDIAGIRLDIYWDLELIVGWRVSPGSQSANFFEVTYTPFVWGGTFGRVNGTTWPAVGSTRFGLQYAYAYAPVALTLYREGRVCFSARYVIEPVHLQNELFAALNECQAEIIDEIINQQPIHLNCNYTNPVNVTIFNINFTDTFANDLIGETCIGF